MTEFQLRFFGGLRLTFGEQELTRPLSTKAQGLICYLASTRRPQTRLKLAGMFWGDKPENDALLSLRVDLNKIRKYISPYIEATRQTIAFVGDDAYLLDTETFENHIRFIQNADGADARAYLRDIAELYTGDFLDGYEAGDAYAFEEWMLAQRESYRGHALSALDKLVEINLSMQEYEAGINTANQILQIDPWREEAYRSLMWLYMRNGQRSAALHQYELCRTVLENEVGVEPDPRTTDLWQRIKNEESDLVVTQPLSLSKSTRTAEKPFQSPPIVPFFSGRDVELRQLAAQLESGYGLQMICIAGMGGVGKTSFAVQWAHQNQDRFEDGVLWANAANDPAAIADRWAAAYDYDFRSIAKVEDRLTALRDILADKQALIVIDDVDVAARVKPLLPTDGKCVVLFTTRNAEMAYALGAELFNLDVLTLENGRSLLSSIIGQTRVQGEQVAADAICQKLQNLPLALAIAGKYLVSRPRRRLATFLSRLEQTVLLDAADSEGVVRASFDISWTALDQVQQQVFALVAVFNGRSFTAKAMAHIANLDFYVMQDHLDTLATRSLLIEQGNESYRQHTLLFHFADEKLIDRQAPSLRMVDYYSGYTDSYGTDYQKLGEEWDNLEASIQIMAEQSLWNVLFRVNQNLNQAWFALALFDRAQHAYQLAHEGALALENAEQIGINLYWRGMSVLEQGQYDKARAFFEPALSIFEELADLVAVSDIQYDLARIHIFQARYQMAEELLERCLRVKQALNDQKGVGQIKYRQAILMSRLGKYDLALQIGNEARLIQEQINSNIDLIRTLHDLVITNCNVKDFDLALSIGERAYALAEEEGDQGELATLLYVLSYANRVHKRFTLALEQVQKSLAMFKKMGDIASQANALLQIGFIYRDTRNFEDCLSYSEKSLRLYKQVSDQLGMAWALGNIGKAYQGLGETELARENWLASQRIALELNNEHWARVIDTWMNNS